MSAPPITYQEYRDRKHFPSLDGLRVIAVFLVVAYHVSGPIALHRWSHGTNGVRLFFVLSGFLITSLCLREEDRFGSVDIVGFLIRRFFRIMPLYYASLGLYTVLILGFNLDPRAEAFKHLLPYFAGFLQEVPWLSPQTRLNNQSVPFSFSWSLGIEEKFYLVWPFVAFVCLRYARQLRLAVALTLAVAAFIAPHVASWGRYVFPYGDILCGVVLALLLHDPATYSSVARLGRSRVVLATVAAAVGAHALTLVTPDNGWLFTAIAVLLPVTFAVMIGSLVTTTSRSARWLDLPLMVKVGQASYALYLLHKLVLEVGERLIPHHRTWVGALASLAFAMVVGSFVCIYVQRWFEEPITAIGRRISARRRANAAVASPLANP